MTSTLLNGLLHTSKRLKLNTKMSSEYIKKDPLFLEGLVVIFRFFLRVQESVVYWTFVSINNSLLTLSTTASQSP